MQKQANIQHKINMLKSILAGTISFEHLRPPQHYFAELNNGVYEVSGVKMDEATFKEWKKKLRDCDHLLIFAQQTANHPLSDVANVEPVVHSEAVKPSPLAGNKKHHRKQAKNDLKSDAAPIEENVLIAVPKRSGKLSEYGDTWSLNKREYFLS